MENAEFDIRTLIDYIEKEYCSDRETIIQTVEESILKVARKNPKFTNDLRIHINRDDLTVHVYDTYVVSDDETGIGFITPKQGRRYNKWVLPNEGDLLEIEIPIKYLGRVCARESRMLILQKIKNIKNCNIISNYRHKIGELVSGTVTGIERGNIIFTSDGKTEMVIPRSEQIMKEHYKTGDSISGVIMGINEKQRNSPIVVSRACNRFVEELMKREISELNDGTLEIVEISRNPGSRMKVAIHSNNSKVDPVGSCVGKNGVRINNIIRELSGERIDIVRYSDNIYEYVKESLSPAKVISIEIDPNDSSTINVVVSDGEYQNAIGRFGQNVTLASRLVRHKINVSKSFDTASFEEKKEYAIATMSDMFDISIMDASTIVNSGYLTVDGIVSDDETSFVESTGLDEVKAKGIYAAARVIHEKQGNIS